MLRFYMKIKKVMLIERLAKIYTVDHKKSTYEKCNILIFSDIYSKSTFKFVTS